MSTTPWKPKNLNYFQKCAKFEFWLVTKSWNHLSFVNISPTLVIDTSMKRSSRVLHHGNPKIWFFSSKKFEIEFDLYFDLCWRAQINIQIGLNMHLYVDIGDASSSLWGSTSSYASPTSGEAYRDWRLTTNFELWVEIFCVSTCFHVRIPKPCLSVCPSVCLSAPREKKSS